MMLFLFNLYLDLCFPSQADDQGVVEFLSGEPFLDLQDSFADQEQCWQQGSGVLGLYTSRIYMEGKRLIYIS